MLQRIFMIVVIMAIIVGGGYYAYTQLIPPEEQEATGPIYSSQSVIRGDITVGVDAVGPLNPSNGGGIQVPGVRDYTNPNGGMSYIIDEVLVQEGDQVKKDQVLVKLAAPTLYTDIEAARTQLEMKKEALATLMNIPVSQVDTVNPANGITLRAPITGRIVHLTPQEGEKIGDGEIVARIVDDSRFQVTAKLTPGEFKRISEESKAVLRFSQFSDLIQAEIVDINPNAIPESSASLESDSIYDGKSSDQYEFVYWVTLEGENPGLVQPDMKAKIGFYQKDEKPEQATYIKYYSKIEKFVKEERIISSTEGIATELFVHKMEPIEAGDPIVALAGEDVRNKIQEKIDDINQAKIDLQKLEAQTGMLEVKATMDGAIAGIHRQQGDSVRSGDWIGSIYTTSDMMMWVQIDDVDVLLVKQGSPVDVTVDALPDKVFEGKVERVSTMGQDQNGISRFQVNISVIGGPDLRPGMQANAYIKAGEAEDALLIPLEAIFQEDNQNKVEILDADGTPKLVQVELGLMNDRYAEVKSGLEEGDKVITGSSADLLPSQKIKSNTLLPSQEENPDDGGNDGGNNGDDNGNAPSKSNG